LTYLEPLPRLAKDNFINEIFPLLQIG